MSIARDRANRSGSDPLIIGSSKISANDSDNLVIQDTSNASKRLIMSEMHVGDNDSDKIVIKRNSSTGRIQLQTVASGDSAAEQQSGAATVYANPNLLPVTGVSAGAHALTTSNNFLYVHNGSGWYKVAAITNEAPTISSAGNASNSFALDGTAINIEITASDPEGLTLQYKYAVSSGSIGSTATVTSSATSGGTYSAIAANTLTTNKYFKITPSTNTAHGGTFSLTFSASDGVNVANSSASSFTLGLSGSTYFDGNGDYARVPNNARFAMGTGDFTIEGWIYPYDSATNQGYFAIGGTNADGFNSGNYATSLTLLRGYNVGGNLTFYGNGAETAFNDQVNPAANTWFHFAFVRISSTLKVYIDGVQKYTGNDGTNYSGQGCILGGAYSTGYLSYFDMSNFRIVKGTGIYTGNFTVPTSNLTNISGTSLLCCQTSSGTTIDNSSHSQTITHYGNTTTSNRGPFS